MQYIHYITHIIYDISSTLCDVTFSMCVTSHNDYIYDIKPYMFMTYLLYMASRTVLWPNSHCVPSQPLCLILYSMYFWYYTQCTNVMKRTVCMSSQPLYEWQHMHYIWHHIHSLWYHTILWHSHTLYWCHHSQDTCHCIQSFWFLTYIVLNIAHLQYLFSQTHYIYGIIWILCDITTALYDIVRWCIHDITSTLFMTSHPLYRSWHTLYLWHHSHCFYDKTATMYLTL